MEFLGYVGFAVLLFLAVTWTAGVRAKLDAGVPTILGALFFVVAAVVLALAGINMLHSLWLVPVGFVLVMFAGLLAIHATPVFQLLRYLASAFANIVRVGIPSERIRAAQEAELKARIEALRSRTEEKEE